MSDKCPKCSHNIPTGNSHCNLCGFEYQKYIDELNKKQRNVNNNNNPAAIITGLIFIIIFIGIYYFINNPYLLSDFFTSKYFSPENIFQTMEYFPFIITGIIFFIIFISMIIVIKSQKK